MQNMGTNFKSYATTQVHFPREREGSLTAKRPNVQIFRLKYGTAIQLYRTHSFLNLQAKFFRKHLFLNLQAKFFNYVLYFDKFPAN